SAPRLPARCSFVLHGTGTSKWFASTARPVFLAVALHAAIPMFGSGWATIQGFGLPGDVAPGASDTLTAAGTAPTTAGSYVLRHRLVKDGVAWFDQIQKTDVTVSGVPALAASYSSTPPTSWSTGQTQSYAITLTNTGSATWNATGANPVWLAVVFGTSSDAVGSGWATIQGFGLPGDVAPGASVTLTVAVTAPTTAGSYVLRHRLVKDGVAWFDQIQKTDVTVSPPAAIAASPAYSVSED